MKGQWSNFPVYLYLTSVRSAAGYSKKNILKLRIILYFDDRVRDADEDHISEIYQMASCIHQRLF